MTAPQKAAADVIRHIHQMAAAGECPATDRELLRRFSQGQDQAAFEQLYRRHAALVRGTSYRALGDAQAAEDVCQATFLLLARKAASQRWKDSVAGWLYQTAHHLALKARTADVRRRRREAHTRASSPANPLSQITAQELLSALDEELLRLPEPLRAPLVLCYLEGETREQAAKHLGCPLATLKNRLQRGLKRLHASLTRRGLGISAVLLATVLTQQSRGLGASTLLARKTARLALAAAAGRSLGPAISSQVQALVEGGVRMWCWNQGKTGMAALLVGGLLSVVGAITLHALAAGPADTAARAARPPSSTAQPVAPPAAAPVDRSVRSVDTGEGPVSFRGVVLGPDGKPMPGAEVYLSTGSYGDSRRPRATADAKGRFEVRPRSGERAAGGWQLVAAAKGYGPAWLMVGDKAEAKDCRLQLVKDDVPVEGRVLTQEGKPVAGAKVRVRSITALDTRELAGLLRALGSGSMPVEQAGSQMSWPPNQPEAVTADGEGRFQMRGVGRDRVVRLHIEGTGIQHWFIDVITTAAALQVPAELQSGPQRVYGAAFEYRAAPGRTITGVVCEKGTGKKLAGVGISGAGTLSWAQTDAGGRYQLTGCAKAKEYYLSCGGSEEHIRVTTAVADTAGLGPLHAPDVELVRGIPVRGKVIDKSTGKPVTHGEVWYFALWPNTDAIKLATSFQYGTQSSAIINADGSFHCPVLPGPGAIAVRGLAGQYASASVDPPAFFKDQLGAAAAQTGDRRSLKIVTAFNYAPMPRDMLQEELQAVALINPQKDTPEIHQKLELRPVRLLKGTVLGPDGKPLAGAKIRGLIEQYEWAKLPEAQFDMPAPDPERPRTLLVVHDGERAVGALEVKGSEKGPLKVRLRPWAVVTGKLVTADGEPYSGCKVFASGDGATNAYPRDVPTARDGTFRIEGLLPGHKYRLSFWALKANKVVASEAITEVTLKAGESRDLGRVKAPAAAGE